MAVADRSQALNRLQVWSTLSNLFNMSKRRAPSRPPIEPTAPEQNATCILPSTRRKRVRLPCHFQSLSDELVLKVLSFLTALELVRCQQVCRQLQRIASDEQVWKSAFYDRFVRPRASRLPASGRWGIQAPLPVYSSRSPIWLDDVGLVNAQNTHWKQFYKLRHNWNRGCCGVTEIVISAAPSESPLAVQMRRVCHYLQRINIGKMLNFKGNNLYCRLCHRSSGLAC